MEKYGHSNNALNELYKLNSLLDNYEEPYTNGHIDDELIISETAFPTTGQKKIERKEYVLPKSSLQGKKTVRVTFRCPANAMGARIFDVRLVKEN